MKKKLLLVGVAAMGLLAVGVGATSTFAWYTASAAVQVTSSSNAYSVGTAKTEVSIEAVGVTFTFAKKTSTADVELLYKAPSASGKYADGTDVAANDIIYAGMANGVTLRQYKWDGNNTAHRLIGEYEVSAAWTDGAPTGARLEALKGKNYTFRLAPAGNVEILTATSLTLSGALTDTQKSDNLAAAKAYTTNTGDTESNYAHVTIRFESTFAGTIGTGSSLSLDHPYFIVKTNNPTGKEFMKSGDTNEDWGQGVSAWESKTYAAGSYVYNGTDNKVYTNASAIESAEASFNVGSAWSEAGLFHDADKIGCVATSVDGVNNG